MKHASPQTLTNFAHLLASIRLAGADVRGLTERKPGTFYVKAAAFLHFHEDPEGLFADLKTRGLTGEFERFRVVTTQEQAHFLRAAKAAFVAL